MSDWLLEAGRNPLISGAVRGLSLPVPFPEPLRRADGPWTATPLAGSRVLLGGAGAERLQEALASAGASPAAGGEDERLSAVVYDATALADLTSLDALHAFFQPVVRKLSRGGRIVLLHPPVQTADGPVEAAARAALDGFVRSLAKELGRKAITVNRIETDARTEDRLLPVLLFLLGNRSSFITGQPWTLSTSARMPAETPAVRPLEGKVALVTGAARGIGAATVGRLGAEGAHVVCLDREQDRSLLEQVASTAGGSVFAIDLTAADAGPRIAEHLRAEFGGVDVVVHNAGITRDKTLGRMSEEAWGAVLDINLRAIVHVTDALLDGVLSSYGRVIALSSVGGIAGNAGQTNYAATKAGLRAWVSGQASALGRRGITVNAVAPGFIETRMTAAMPPVPREFGRRLSALGQGGEPLDIAETITFLASPGAAGVTGQTLRVCGGLFFGA